MGPGFCCYRFNSYLDTVSTVKLAVCFDTFNTPQNCSRFDTDITCNASDFSNLTSIFAKKLVSKLSLLFGGST